MVKSKSIQVEKCSKIFVDSAIISLRPYKVIRESKLAPFCSCGVISRPFCEFSIEITGDQDKCGLRLDISTNSYIKLSTNKSNSSVV